MRIEEVAAKDYSQHSNSRQRMKRAPLAHRYQPMTAFTCFDTAECATKGPDQAIEWLASFVRMIPDDLAAEKARPYFFPSLTKDDCLVQKLLFFVL